MLATISKLRTFYDPESRSDVVRRALVDPIFFGETYVRPHDVRWTTDTREFQRDMVYHVLKGSRFDPEILKEVPRPEDAQEFARTSYSALLVPIEHTKTTWLSVVLPLWITLVDQEAKGALIGNRAEDAQKPLSVIRWHLEHNQRLRADFPELRPDYRAGVSETRIFVQRRDRTKDPTIQTTGITGTIQGARLDYAFGDDVQDRRRALSEIMNQADQENWQEIIENRVVDGGICSTYGTLQTKRDLTNTMATRPGYRHMHLSAYDRDGRYGEPGEPLMMTRERLKLARERQGERRFARKYLNESKDEGGKQLKAEWLKFVEWSDVNFDGAGYFAGADPATGEAEGPSPDEYSITYGIKEKSGRVVVLGIVANQKWGIYEGTMELAKLHKKYQLRKVAVESVAFQVAQKQMLWRETSVPAYKAPTPKTSKETRFESMGALFDIGRVVVYSRGEGIYGDDETENFYDQWIDFPEGRHDDRLDSTELFLQAALGSALAQEPVDEETRQLLANAKLVG